MMMTRTAPNPRVRCRRRSARRGTSLVEIAISTILIGVMFVAAINTVAASRAVEVRTSERARGHQLASDLMNEILTKEYEDPDQTPVFAREVAEVWIDRSTLDDVDDYHMYDDSPPTSDGTTAIAGFDKWSRKVDVAWVNPASPGVTSGSETGAKRIQVTAYRGDLKVAEITAVRTRGW